MATDRGKNPLSTFTDFKNKQKKILAKPLASIRLFFAISVNPMKQSGHHLFSPWDEQTIQLHSIN